MFWLYQNVVATSTFMNAPTISHIVKSNTYNCMVLPDAQSVPHINVTMHASLTVYGTIPVVTHNRLAFDRFHNITSAMFFLACIELTCIVFDSSWFLQYDSRPRQEEAASLTSCGYVSSIMAPTIRSKGTC